MQSLLFYIGNGIIKCGLVELHPDSLPKLLFSESSSVDNDNEKTEKAELELSLIRSLDDLCQKSRKKLEAVEIKNKKINKVICIISSPWYLSETKTLTTKKDEPFLIKTNTISDFIAEAEKNMTESHPETMEPLEKKIIHVALNGYVTTEPMHQKASSMEVSLVESFVDKKLMDDVRNVTDKYFDADEFKFHTLSLASFITLRDVLGQKDNFLLIDVTSLITEISLVKESILYETISLPIGTNHLINLTAKELKVTFPIALSMLERYKDGQVESRVNAKIKTSIEKFKTDWNKYLTDAFSHLSGGVSLPSACYLIRQIPLESTFATLVSAEDYSQFSFSEGKFKVEVVTGMNFIAHVDFNKQPLDPTLAILALFCSPDEGEYKTKESFDTISS